MANRSGQRTSMAESEREQVNECSNEATCSSRLPRTRDRAAAAGGEAKGRRRRTTRTVIAKSASTARTVLLPEADVEVFFFWVGAALARLPERPGTCASVSADAGMRRQRTTVGAAHRMRRGSSGGVARPRDAGI